MATVDFDCRTIFSPEGPSKLEHINGKKIKDAHPVKTPSLSRVMINKLVFFEKSKPSVFLWSPSVFETWIQHLL